jgi:ParB family transcriptional regulator, chromosome partitioning protein
MEDQPMNEAPPTVGKSISPNAPRRALGRGLDALLPTAPVAMASPKEGVLQIELSRIDPNPFQSRRHFDQEKLQELSQSIRNHGVMQPIVVRRSTDRYVLIAGERRWRAASLAGLAAIPAIVREVSDKEVLELTLIENVQREDLNPIETAEAFARLANEAGLTHEQIANRTGKDRTTVTNLLRLLRLPKEIQERIETGELSPGHARALLKLPTESSQVYMATRVVAQGLSVRRMLSLFRRSKRRLCRTQTYGLRLRRWSAFSGPVCD